jgi:hypothetical protein
VFERLISKTPSRETAFLEDRVVEAVEDRFEV